jgi:hypothetical protein
VPRASCYMQSAYLFTTDTVPNLLLLQASSIHVSIDLQQMRRSGD